MSIHDNKLHVMLSAVVLGEGYTAPLVEIAACVFDPTTGEVTPDLLTVVANVKGELRNGKAESGQLVNFMLANKYNSLVLDNPDYFESAATCVKKLCGWFDAMRIERGVGFENTLVYVMMPVGALPRIEFIHHTINRNEVGIWPSYGVRCAKTIQDLARPKLVDLAIDLGTRPPVKNGLGDENNHMAIATMHSLLLLTDEHPKQTGGMSGKRAKPPIVYEDDDL